MYTALYRKKRPTSFEGVVGQRHIVTTLRNQLRNGNITHAYLFCGTRGTGKTSCAKIFARAVNCPHSAETGEPCNDCESCKDIIAERNLNVIEIDAASNNGVDNIRDLREEVKYPPTSGKFKVYIIDEAHMLTTAAFNALLKTLEEPPGHIIFILATTDPQKIPATILSRCQRYDFKRISREDMVSTLAAYMQKDGHSAEKEALEYIASASDGAMRDALSILDQALSLYSGEAITLAKIQNLLGAVDQSALFAYGEALFAQSSADALKIISQAAKEGRDLSRFTADIITHFRNLLIAAQAPDILDYAPETIERYIAQSKALDPNNLIDYIHEFSELQNQMRYLPSERLALEVTSIKLSSTTPPARGPSGPLPAAALNVCPPDTQRPLTPSMGDTSDSQPVSETNQLESSGQDATAKWADFCNSLSGLLKSMLTRCTAQWDEGGNVTITCRDSGSLQYLKDHQPQIVSELKKFFNQPTNPIVVFNTNEGYNDKDTFKENISAQINMTVEFE